MTAPPAAGPTSAAQLLAACDALAEVLATRAAGAEELRRLPDATVADAAATGLFGALLARPAGGSGLGLADLCGATRTLGHGCTSSAWTLSFLALHVWLASKFPDEGRAELFDGGLPLAAAPLAVTGTATRDGSDWVVEGRWEWATGVRHSDWVMVHALEQGPELRTRFAMVPVAEVEVLDDWHISGMCGTGSSTVVVRGVRVPEHRTLPAATLMQGVPAADGEGLGQVSLVPVLSLVAAAPSLGAAEAVVGLHQQRLGERILAYSIGDKAADQPAAQVRFGTARAELAAARARFDTAVAEVEAVAATGPLPPLQRADARLAAAATVRASRSVIATVAEGAGATPYRSGHPLQRFQRDVEVLKGHAVFDWDRAAELAGRVALGQPLRPTDMA